MLQQVVERQRAGARWLLHGAGDAATESLWKLLVLLRLMTAIIYTYPDDYLMAGLSARIMAAQGIRVIFAIDAKDPFFACEFGQCVATRFPRSGNLNGKEFILGNLRLMREHADGDYVFKVDSDTLLLDATRLLEGRNEVIVGPWVDGMQGMYGGCYAVRAKSLPAMIEAAEALPDSPYYMEDKTTGELARKVGPVHLPKFHAADSLYTAWKPANPPEWYRERKAVVVLNRTESFRKDSIAREMKRFL